ncbi:MAG: zinc-ribbon domain-containing protein [Desulfamplus sp.]|nr:zinc-ribbon domain-containing protein [Desulfamplus sp.]
MEIACNHCQTQFKIPDEKIPKGKKVSFPCPKCKEPINILVGEDGRQNSQPAASASNAREDGDTPEYNVANRPFGDMLLDKGAKTAMLCVANPTANEAAVKTINSMKYHVLNVGNVQTAITSMTYHLFNIIIVDEDFDITQKGYRRLMEYLNQLDMMSRRKIVVFLISKNIYTMDNMASLHSSVDQVVNHNQINSMESLLQRTILEHEQFYAVYNDSLIKLGKLS